jgi:hypothetical protein
LAASFLATQFVWFDSTTRCGLGSKGHGYPPV